MRDEIFDIKEDLGRTLKSIRNEKGFTQGKLSDKILSRPQISNIESGKQSTTFENVIYFMDKLNITYEELLFRMDDDYHTSKERTFLDISKYANAGDTKGLERLKRQSEESYLQFKVPYFLFLKCIAEARIILLNNMIDFEPARKVLKPVKDYLETVKTFSYQDFLFIAESLYIFDIETSKKLVDRALAVIDDNHAFYRNKKIGGAITLNMALYALDFPDKLRYALDYSLKSMELSTSSTHLSTTLKAKITYQIACYKLGNGRYNVNVIRDCLNIYQVAEWHGQHKQITQFLDKHHIIV